MGRDRKKTRENDIIESERNVALRTKKKSPVRVWHLTERKLDSSRKTTRLAISYEEKTQLTALQRRTLYRFHGIRNERKKRSSEFTAEEKAVTYMFVISEQEAIGHRFPIEASVIKKMFQLAFLLLGH